MKKMTKEQIDEINKLLETNGAALTEFYDEAIHYGKLKGGIIGVAGTLLITGICHGVYKIKNHKKVNEES